MAIRRSSEDTVGEVKEKKKREELELGRDESCERTTAAAERN